MNDDIDDALAQAVMQQLIDSRISAIRREVHHPVPSLSRCAECGNPIPEKRRESLPGVQLCVGCQAVKEFNERVVTGKGLRYVR